MMPHFQYPYVLLLLFFIPFFVWRHFHTVKKRKASVKFPSIKIIQKIPSTWALKSRHLLIVLRMLVLSLFVIALARPQKGEHKEKVTTHGVDIVLAVDISSSMQTMDFKPKNRLNVAKGVIQNFVLGRQNDRIGLVVFAGKSFTQCPLTLDYGILVEFLKQVDFGMVEDGTAIGTALLNSANRLRESDAKSKVIILLTDGENTAGEVDPITAAKAISTLGIKVYTIGVGKNGMQPIPVDDPVFGRQMRQIETKVDEKSLKQIAQVTNGKFFRAQNKKALHEIYETIDKLEKTEIETTSYTSYVELFSRFLLAGLLLLFIEIVLFNTRFMKIP